MMAPAYAPTTSSSSWLTANGSSNDDDDDSSQSPPMTTPVRIPPSDNNNRKRRVKQKSADVVTMSKSLGSGYSHHNVFRQSTDVTKISYAGCLYKRSNHPVTSPTSVTNNHNNPQQQQQQHGTPAIGDDDDGEARNLFRPVASSLHPPGDGSATTTDAAERQPDESGTGSSGLLLGASPSFGMTTSLADDDGEDGEYDKTDTTWQRETHGNDTPAWQFLVRLLDLPAPLLPPKHRDTAPGEEEERDGNTSTTCFSSTQQQQRQQKQQQRPVQTLRSSSRLSSSPIPVPLTLSNRSSNNNNVTNGNDAASSSPVGMRRVHSQSDYHSHNDAGDGGDDDDDDDDWPRRRRPVTARDDVIAPDGHVWRARYCVLDDGILYFYRCRADAEDPLAVAERSEDHEQQEAKQRRRRQRTPLTTTTTTTTTTGGPPSLTLSSSLKQSSSSSASILAQSPRVFVRGVVAQHIWEKRVPVSCVGAVRSAEAEYGAHALQLCPLEDSDDDGDVLILKARNATEMGEWLFQLHRSIELWVKNIMTTTLFQQDAGAGSGHDSSSSIVGEMIVPASSQQEQQRHRAPWMSSSGTPSSVLLSPRIRPHLYHHHHHHHHHHHNNNDMAVLSHGHGRSSLHRRRVEDVQEEGRHHESDSYQTTNMPFMPDADSQATPLPLQPAVALQAYTPPTPVTEQFFVLDDVDTLSPEQTAPTPPEMRHPVPPKKYVPPHLRKAAVVAAAAVPPRSKYVPPHLRHKAGVAKAVTPTPPTPSVDTEAPVRPPLSLTERLARDETSATTAQSLTPPRGSAGVTPRPAAVVSAAPKASPPPPGPLKLGGCADPDDVQGSILDAEFIPRKASKLKRTAARPYGFRGAQWEIGAVSECGVRDANEDSYLIVGDLWQAFDKSGGKNIARSTSLDDYKLEQTPGLFCVFDGHCGDHAARYAAERFTHYLYEESTEGATDVGKSSKGDSREGTADHVESLIRQALSKLDDDFCNLCVQGDRLWESGATALIAALVDDDLVIANLGDARGVLSRSVQNATPWEDIGWTLLQEEDELMDEGETSSNDDGPPSAASTTDRLCCVFKDVTPRHNPSRPDERRRIEDANGWITTEAEIPVSQAHRLDLHDEDAREILSRCLSRNDGEGASAPHRLIEISRVCGELAVSRALGDRDFKALSDPECDGLTNNDTSASWQGSCFLPYPEDHNKRFLGDLVSNIPEFRSLRIGQDGVTDEFLLLACDGLWDVMDAEDAIRVTRRLLLDQDYSVKAAAARLATLAVHLGSSDNVTVLIIRFVDREP